MSEKFLFVPQDQSTENVTRLKAVPVAQLRQVQESAHGQQFFSEVNAILENPADPVTAWYEVTDALNSNRNTSRSNIATTIINMLTR